MESDFLFWEVHIIRRQMKKLSAEDIAYLMEKPVPLVKSKIMELTGGLPSAYELKLIKKHNAALKKKVSAGNAKISNRPNRTPRKVKVIEKVFKTKEVDTRKMIAVKVDAKTIIYVKEGSDIEAIKQKYRERDHAFKKPENPNIVVKKFKPL